MLRQDAGAPIAIDPASVHEADVASCEHRLAAAAATFGDGLTVSEQAGRTGRALNPKMVRRNPGQWQRAVGGMTERPAPCNAVRRCGQPASEVVVVVGVWRSVGNKTQLRSQAAHLDAIMMTGPGPCRPLLPGCLARRFRARGAPRGAVGGLQEAPHEARLAADPQS